VVAAVLQEEPGQIVLRRLPSTAPAASQAGEDQLERILDGTGVVQVQLALNLRAAVAGAPPLNANA